jgi:hypothetical protein
VGEFSVFLRGRPECQINFSAAQDTEWRRATITVRGEEVKAELDGKALPGAARSTGAARGPIGLGRKGGAVQFANIYVKELAGR